MTNQKNPVLTPLVIAAALSVLAFSGIGVAAITGHLSITHSSLNPFSSFSNIPASGIIQAPAVPTEGHEGLTRHRGGTLAEGKPVSFRPPLDFSPAALTGTKVLCYHNAEDPEFLHVTTGDGRIHGTWAVRGRGSFLDAEALAKQMRYTHAAREAAQTTARELAEPQRASLEAMREHNARLAEFNVVTDAPMATATLGTSGIGAALLSVPTTSAGLKSNPPKVMPADDCTAELLQRSQQAAANADEEHYD